MPAWPSVEAVCLRPPGLGGRLHDPPHFHATCGDHEIAVAIRDGEVLWGTFPKRALAHVAEWRGSGLLPLVHAESGSA
ncbi:MAG TPA: DUF4160 domain-containing protein, partial [Vicinamibacteria bacterium]|nr:DUF4160 domain-containing protein [Vicinamibacteria bacterium]